MISSFVLLILILCVLYGVNDVNGQPEGWKMTDRFYGFRYEISFTEWDSSALQKIIEEADDLACFGWVQESPSHTIVGEARCTKARGPIFEERLRKISSKVSNFERLVRKTLFSSLVSRFTFYFIEFNCRSMKILRFDSISLRSNFSPKSEKPVSWILRINARNSLPNNISNSSSIVSIPELSPTYEK
jgi:hypothetical protein